MKFDLVCELGPTDRSRTVGLPESSDSGEPIPGLADVSQRVSFGIKSESLGIRVSAVPNLHPKNSPGKVPKVFRTGFGDNPETLSQS